MSHKIRAFELFIHPKGLKTLPLDHADPRGDGIGSQKVLEEVFGAALGQLRAGVPPTIRIDEWVEPANPDYGTPQLKINKISNVGDSGHHLLIEFGYGHRGIHEEAAGITETVDIHDKAALSTFRALFLLPDSGSRGIVLVDSVNRKTPMELLCAWFRWLNKDEAKPLNLKARQIADHNYLIRMLNEATSVRVRLEETAHGTVGKPRVGSILEMRPSGEVKREQIVQQAIEWLGFDSERNYVSAMTEILDLSVEKLAEADLNFDTVKIVVSSEKGDKTISPDDVREKFDYEVNHAQIRDGEFWLSKVSEFYSSSTLSEGIDIVW